jgi:hypothetical protein
MALHIQCQGCLTWEIVDCICPPGLGAHVSACPVDDLDAQVNCAGPLSANCCKVAHNHGKAANACLGDHAEAPCSSGDPAKCSVWANTEGDGDCPGGHCGVGVDGCTVCRPITITVLAGSVQMTHANLAALPGGN